jgi:hypothetical protein
MRGDPGGGFLFYGDARKWRAADVKLGKARIALLSLVANLRDRPASAAQEILRIADTFVEAMREFWTEVGDSQASQWAISEMSGERPPAVNMDRRARAVLNAALRIYTDERMRSNYHALNLRLKSAVGLSHFACDAVTARMRKLFGNPTPFGFLPIEAVR